VILEYAVASVQISSFVGHVHRFLGDFGVERLG
jgi:hypothetical protein